MKNASTIPSNMVWVIESAIMDILRSTKNTPGSAQATATITAMSCISRCGEI